jgi:hypothetical protein
VVFEFFDPGVLDGGNFELIRFATLPPDPTRGLVPDYDLRIRVNGSDLIGHISLRIGMTDHIMFYAGNLGYKVNPAYRGRRLPHAPSSYYSPLPDIMGCPNYGFAVTLRIGPRGKPASTQGPS